MQMNAQADALGRTGVVHHVERAQETPSGDAVEQQEICAVKPEISAGHLQPPAAQVKRHTDADQGATHRQGEIPKRRIR